MDFTISPTRKLLLLLWRQLWEIFLYNFCLHACKITKKPAKNQRNNRFLFLESSEPINASIPVLTIRDGILIAP